MEYIKEFLQTLLECFTGIRPTQLDRDIEAACLNTRRNRVRIVHWDALEQHPQRDFPPTLHVSRRENRIPPRTSRMPLRVAILDRPVAQISLSQSRQAPLIPPPHIDESEIGVKWPSATVGPGIERRVWSDPSWKETPDHVIDRLVLRDEDDLSAALPEYDPEAEDILPELPVAPLPVARPYGAVRGRTSHGEEYELEPLPETMSENLPAPLRVQRRVPSKAPEGVVVGQKSQFLATGEETAPVDTSAFDLPISPGGSDSGDDGPLPGPIPRIWEADMW